MFQEIITFLFPLLLIIGIYLYFMKKFSSGPQKDMLGLMQEQLEIMKRQNEISADLAAHLKRIGDILENQKSQDIS